MALTFDLCPPGATRSCRSTHALRFVLTCDGLGVDHSPDAFMVMDHEEGKPSSTTLQ